MEVRFENRREAGEVLASKLKDYANQPDMLVLALPRGGVPVGFEVAKALNAPLDVFLVRKLGVPGHEELAMGAIASGGVRVLNSYVVSQLHLTQQVIDRVAREEIQELERREQAYRGERSEPEIEGKTVILVDDGLATGASMRVAVTALRERNPARIVVGVPTASDETCNQFLPLVDEIVCARTPEPFMAVGLWYRDFDPTMDNEVQDLLAEARRRGFGRTAEGGEHIE